MTNQQLKKLRREELLRMLLELERENEALAEENRLLRNELQSRQIAIKEAGSLAEAALRLSGVFEAAQKAADLYLENVKNRCEHVDEKGADAL